MNSDKPIISYTDKISITPEEAINLYNASSLGERRPVDKPEVFAHMLRHADILVTAWHDKKLVGVARTLTDYSYVAYLADLAVDEAYQHNGIGKRLIDETRLRLEPGCMITLLAAPKANDYYPKLGFTHNPRAWTLREEDELP